MTTASPIFRMLWLALLCLPLICLVWAFDSRRHARSADEGLEHMFALVALFGLVALLGLVVFLRSLMSDNMRTPERLIAASVGLSVVPMYFLLSATSWYIGWPGRGPSTPIAALILGLNALWVALVLATGRRLHTLRHATQPMERTAHE